MSVYMWRRSFVSLFLFLYGGGEGRGGVYGYIDAATVEAGFMTFLFLRVYLLVLLLSGFKMRGHIPNAAAYITS